MAEIHTYRTIAKEGQSDYREKGSKFFGYAFHCANENEFKDRLEQLRKEHHQARHHCFAYVLEEDGSVQRSTDDGEPGGTAGKPILAPIGGRGLTYTGVVVVRYFGGTKLGKGGLVRAYGGAAKYALENARLRSVELTERIVINCGINIGEKLKGAILNEGGHIVQSNYSQEVELVVNYPKRLVEAFCADLIDRNIQVFRPSKS